MKIGIVTQPLWGNYGGILQNYALQQVLKSLGHEPITLDYIWNTRWYQYLKDTIKSCILWFIPNRRRKFGKFLYRPVRENMTIDEFIRKHIATTEYIYRYKKSIVGKYELDALITGSDQVWRPKYNPDLKDMYLGFTMRKEMRKIAYAASFGTSMPEYSERQISDCKPAALEIDSISVREQSGIELVKRYFNLDATLVVDPTLLLMGTDYRRLIEDIPQNKINYISAYILDEDDEIKYVLEQVKTVKKIETVKRSTEGTQDISPKEWLAVIRDADFVVTDSFHGTVFSIMFQKPFISLCNLSRGADRFVSLLTPLGLEDRLMTGSYDNLKRLITADIDWTDVKQKLAVLRDRSLDFLKSSLSSKQ